MSAPDPVEVYRPRLYGFALRLCRGDRTEAEDLVQTTMTNAYLHADQFPAILDMDRWLFTVMRNEWINLARRHYNTNPPVELRDDFHATEGSNPFALVEQRLAAATIRRMIGALPGNMGRVMTVYILGENTLEETARICGLTVRAVKSLVFRGRHLIQERMKQGDC